MSVGLDELHRLLDELSDEPEPIAFSKLFLLSDLSGERLASFGRRWNSYSVDRRRNLAQSLAELAETSFEVNFDAIFVYALDDPDKVVRATAVDGLWENESSSLIGVLVTMLRVDPSSRVRAAAASGLGRYVLAGELDQLEAPVQARIMTELLTVLRMAKESVRVRRRAIESVSFACTPDVLDALEIAYYDEDESMRLSAVVGMGRSCDTRWQPILMEELTSQLPAMRYEASLACGELGLEPAVPLLGRLLGDPDREVSSAAVRALGQIGGDRSKDVLIAAFDLADEDLQDAVEEALAEHALAEARVDLLLVDVERNLESDLYNGELELPWSEDEEADDELGPLNWDTGDGWPGH